MSSRREDSGLYSVVVNVEKQYSIWPKLKVLPDGWQTVGKDAPKRECLEFIDSVWTDMSPASLQPKAHAERH